MVVGIPNGMYSNISNLMYKTFLNNLGIKVIFSENTTKKIKEDGIKYSVDEACLASKIYIGHVKYLVDKYKNNEIDYILIPRLCTYSKNETECVRFYAMYDICKNIFKAKFISLNIDYRTKNNEAVAYIKLSQKLGFSKIKGYIAYVKAKRSCNFYDKENINYNLKKIKDNNKKILIVSHPYIYNDLMLGKPICDFLKSQNLDLIYASNEKTSKNLYKKNN